MEWIKELAKQYVSEENLEAFVEGVKKEFPKHAALKSDFNGKIAEIENLNGQLEKVNGEIASLKDASNPNEELKAKLETMTSDFETFKLDTQKRETQRSIKETLKKTLSKSFNDDAVDLLADTYKLDDMTINEAGEIVDIESKINRLKEQRPSLVKSYVADGTPPADRVTKPEVDTSKMSDDEYFAAKAAEKGEK